MSIRVSRRALKGAFAIAGVVVGAAALTGCTSIGSRTFGGDTMATGATNQIAQPNYGQPMPSSLGAPTQVAQAQFVPPGNVGGFPGVQQGQPAYNNGQQPAWNNQPAYNSQPAYSQPTAYVTGAPPSVASQDLPVLSSTSPMGTPQAMPAQQNLAPAAVMPQTAALANPVASPMPAPANNGGGYTHTIASGESLYTIARRYDVTTQALVQANGLTSPDKIVVGQKITIPGRADLLATKAPAPTTQIASIAPMAPTPAQQQAGANVLQAAATPTPPAQPQAAPVQTTPTQVAALPQEPAASGADKFAWPVSGRVITDFSASKGTGINVEIPEGTSVKAAENGTVIYVGSGVEGYGNLVLIRHPNGFVSAYAHLKSMAVNKNDVVQRGQSIGAAGMTGSVSKPQLHFELRKGATPVDPVPLLAG